MEFIDKDIAQMVKEGQIFDSIHLLRKRYSIGLNDAKAYIDAIKAKDLDKVEELHKKLKLPEKRKLQEKELNIDLDILEAIEENQKLKAIKICLDRYSIDAIQAKKFIDAVIVHDKTLMQEYAPNPIEKESVTGGTSESESYQSLEDQEVINLLRNGNEMLAVNYYRDRYQVNLLEARQAVDLIKARYL